jgi:farnesol kinase
MLPGLFPFILAAVPHPDPLGWNEVWFIAQICIVLTAAFLALHKVVRRPDEKNLLSTTLSYPLTIVAMLALFPAHSEFTCVVVSILAFGDGAAYFGGTLFGKRKLPWNPQKSWAGMFSFVLFSAPVAALAYWVEARNPDAPLLLAIACATAASVAGAIAESLRTQITDNLRVGIAASLGVVAAHYAFAGLLLR